MAQEPNVADRVHQTILAMSPNPLVAREVGEDRRNAAHPRFDRGDREAFARERERQDVGLVHQRERGLVGDLAAHMNATAVQCGQAVELRLQTVIAAYEV